MYMYIYMCGYPVCFRLNPAVHPHGDGAAPPAGLSLQAEEQLAVHLYIYIYIYIHIYINIYI